MDPHGTGKCQTNDSEIQDLNREEWEVAGGLPATQVGVAARLR